MSYESSAEFNLALDDIAQAVYPEPSFSADDFFLRWEQASSDVTVCPFEPERQTAKQCAGCGRIAWPDGLGGFMCSECGDDVETVSLNQYPVLEDLASS